MIYKNTWCQIFIITISTFNSVLCDCCESWDRSIPDEAIYTCYQQNITNECKFELHDDLKIHYPNENEGTVDFEFRYEPNCKYLLKLFMWREVNNKENCKTHNIEVVDASDHSRYTYNGVSEFSNEISQHKCKEKGIITAKYLNTGCYYFEFLKNGQIVKNDRIYFTISYKSLNYSDFKSETAFYVQHRHADSTLLEIKHPFLKDNPNLYLKINCTNCKTPSYGLFWICPSLNDAGSLMEYNNNCLNESAHININCESIDVDSIVCTATGLNNGLYEFAYIFKNLIRCPPCRTCIWERCYERTERIIGELRTVEISVASAAFPFTFVIVGIVCTGIILTIAYLIYRWRWKDLEDDLDDSNSSVCAYTDKEVLLGNSKILLLYPQDTEVVMEAMKTLRIALEAEGFKVYDIYDEDQQISINEIKEKWIIDKLSDKHVKTVIVQTYCGQILSKSLHSAEKLYKKPTCYDTLFPYALSLISARVDPNSYSKLFVADLGFDKMDFTEFKFLNPSVRYGLPQNFIELVRDLHDRKQCSVNITKNKNVLREFTFMCKNMKNFIEDPNYLTEILNVSIFKIGDKIQIDDR